MLVIVVYAAEIIILLYTILWKNVHTEYVTIIKVSYYILIVNIFLKYNIIEFFIQDYRLDVDFMNFHKYYVFTKNYSLKQYNNKKKKNKYVKSARNVYKQDGYYYYCISVNYDNPVGKKTSYRNFWKVTDFLCFHTNFKILSFTICENIYISALVILLKISNHKTYIVKRSSSAIATAEWNIPNIGI